MNFKKRVNGSWTDTPHYIHNTSTDTITTLPAVIYANDTTATVGLKGNTLQSSIPSPTSPVMPQGTGDLETSGTKAGQYKIPISSANTTTPVYLGEVETTRRVKKLVLTGDENWKLWAMSASSTTERFYINIVGVGAATGICSHIGYAEDNSDMIHFRFGGTNKNELLFWIDKQDASTVEDFKSYLAAQYSAGTPVCVWYVLETPTTGIVNEPLCKIGDYADEVSDITIPTIAGANTISVDTTLQPSEVSVNYKGWHPVADVHERKNGQWD